MADRRRVPAERAPPATRRCGRRTEGLPSREYFEAAFPGFDTPAREARADVRPARHARGDAAAEAAAASRAAGVGRGGGRQRRLVRVGAGRRRREPGSYVIVIGTSICDMIVDTREVRLPGITGVVKDGILPGLYGYEAGQVAVGDMLAWFVDKMAPARDIRGARERRRPGFAPGETGLVALDWWNGNRTILADADLTGVISGLTLQQHARGDLPGAAGVDRVRQPADHGELRRARARAERDRRLRRDRRAQPADRCSCSPTPAGCSVHVPASSEIPARGAALFGAVAAGYFDDIGSGDRGDAAGGGSHLPPGRRGQGGLRRGVCDLPRACTSCSAAPRSSCCTALKRIRTTERRAS